MPEDEGIVLASAHRLFVNPRISPISPHTMSVIADVHISVYSDDQQMRDIKHAFHAN